MDEGTVSVFDTANNNALLATIPVTGQPHGVAIAPNGLRVYVTSFDTPVVSVINTLTNSVIAEIPSAGSPYGVAVSPDNAWVYVSVQLGSGDKIQVIEAASNTQSAEIFLPDDSAPRGLAVSPDGSRLYITGDYWGKVWVVNTQNNSLTGEEIEVGRNPEGLAVTPDGSKVYVANRADCTVSVIDTGTNTVIETIGVDGAPFGVLVTPDGTHVYVTSVVSSVVVDTVIATPVNSRPSGVAATPGGANTHDIGAQNGRVTVIATATDTVVQTISAGSEPLGVSVTPDGSRVYVADRADNQALVIETASNTVTATASAGVHPVSFGTFIGAPLLQFQSTGGSTQSTQINTQFAQGLEVRVTDPAGDPVAGVTVTFMVNPDAGGAAATLSPALTATTDADGIASVTATANGTTGSYTVTASVTGVTGSATFNLTNTPESPSPTPPSTSMTCTANTAQPSLVRYEGLAEEVGQVSITCTGGLPAPVGGPIQKVNIQVFLGTNITSRLVNTSTNGSEALLLMDAPPVGDRAMCASPGNCTMQSVDGNGSVNSYRNGNYNVFQGTQTGPNTITFFGVPLDAPGPNTRELRIVNIRANANQAGLSGTLIPNDIRMVITLSGTGAPTLTNPVQTVAFVLQGMTFSASTATFNQCEPQDGTTSVPVTFWENFGTAFRPNSTADQRVIGTIYNTESMFLDSNISPVIGQATQGTRLMVRITDIPAGVALSVSNRNNNYVAGVMAAALLTGADTDGAGGSYSTSPVAGKTQLLSTTAANRSAVAVWEVLAAQPGVTETFRFDVYIEYDSDSMPAIGTALASGGYAPVSTVGAASPIAPAPRFVLNAEPSTSFTIVSCQTNLLFPFIAFDGGFDTGIAISNTSSDPYGTPRQTGKCRIYFYGNTDSDDETTVDIEPGKQLVFTLSGGNPAAGIPPKPGFVGYAIARCHFQYAHGYAFISDLGATDLAQGYLALVLDDPMPKETRRNGAVAQSETLNQ